MESQVLELEGTWEEIVEHADELVGRRVRLVVLPDQPADENGIEEFSTANSLLKHAGTWIGDDFEECLQAVYAARGQAKF